VQAYSLLMWGPLALGFYPRLVGCRLTACLAVRHSRISKFTTVKFTLHPVTFQGRDQQFNTCLAVRQAQNSQMLFSGETGLGKGFTESVLKGPEPFNNGGTIVQHRK